MAFKWNRPFTFLPFKKNSKPEIDLLLIILDILIIFDNLTTFRKEQCA